MSSLIIILSTLLGIFFSTTFISASPTQVVEKDIVYREFQGTNLSMDIYFPEPRGARSPLVVYIHGGGWYSGDKATGFGLKDIPVLTQRGYIVASINYRLAPRYVFPAQIEDVEYAVGYLRSHASTYGIDPDHIGVMGESAGGHLAALSGLADGKQWSKDTGNGMKESARVQAVVDLFGPTDLRLTFEQHWRLLIEHVFNTSDPESEIIRQASPITYVSENAPPFLIIQGDKDNQVLPDQSQEIYDKLIANHTDAKLMMVKNASHELLPEGGPISPTRGEISESIADFLDHYLK